MTQEAGGLVVLEITLDDANDEEKFLTWWNEARRLLGERFRLLSTDLCITERAHYSAYLWFPLTGAAKLFTRDRRWQALEAQLPPSRLGLRSLRRWHTTGNPHDMTTAELRRWVEERDAGHRDFVILDTLGQESYHQHHLPGAIHMPADGINQEQARALVGADLERPVVVYCGGYG